MNPVSCEQVREWILDWPRLGPEERRQVERHLAECDTCRAFFEEERQLRQEFQDWSHTLRVYRFRWSRALASFGATLLLVLGILGGLVRTTAPGPQVLWRVNRVPAVLETPGPILVTVGATARDLALERHGAPPHPVQWFQVQPSLPEVRVVAPPQTLEESS